MATKTSNPMEDTLTGRDESIDVEDVFNSKLTVGHSTSGKHPEMLMNLIAVRG